MGKAAGTTSNWNTGRLETTHSDIPCPYVYIRSFTVGF